MNKFAAFLIFSLFPMCFWAQSQLLEDPLYVEDQFYAGISYNFLFSLPDGVNQSNLSYGLQLGFIKDMPLNSVRNKAIGVGLGYAVNNYYQNLKITQISNGFDYKLIDPDVKFKRNKIEMHLIELPIEYRWRTGTDKKWNNTAPDEYKFWRIYVGGKLGYAFKNRAKFIGENDKEIFELESIQKLQYGLTTTLGYNNWNFNIYYGLNHLFENNTIASDGQSIKFMPIRVGLLFYIL